MNEQNNIPNLSPEPCGGRLLVNTITPKERYANPSECAKKRNIPKQILWIAKKENAPGIKEHTVNWDELQPWLQLNYQRLLEKVNEKERSAAPRLDLKEQKLTEEIKALRNKNKREDKAYINSKVTFDTIDEVAHKWEDGLRQKVEYELPVKGARLDEVKLGELCKQIVDQILYDCKTPISELKKKSGTPITEATTAEEKPNETKK